MLKDTTARIGGLRPANESTLSSRRHEVLRGTGDTSFSRSARRFSAEPRQQPPVCSCGLLGAYRSLHCCSGMPKPLPQHVY